MTDNDDTQPIAPHRDLEPPEPKADADITSGSVGTPPITDADITETVVDLSRPASDQTKIHAALESLDMTWTEAPDPTPSQWVDGLGEVEITEAPDEVMFVGSDATIEVWRRPDPAGVVAEASLVDADAVAEKSFVEGVAFHRFREATDVLLDHLLATEATRASAEPGEILPAFGLGEPPLYEVAAHAVQRETALQSAEMYRRSMEREPRP